MRDIARLLRPHAAGESASLSAGAALGMVVVALQVLRPWPVKWILDSVAGVADARSLSIAALSGVFVLISVGGAAAEYAQVMTLTGAANRILFRFRSALFTHVLRQPLAFHESREMGELLTRIVYDTSRLRRGLNGILLRIVQTIVLFIATTAVLVWIDPLLGAVMATGGALALLSMRARGRRIASAARKQRRKEGRLAGLVANELSAIREIQTFGIAQSAAAKRFGDRNSKSLRQEQKVRRLAAGLSLRVDALLAISVAIALGVGAGAAMANRITAGDLVLFFSYALALRAPFSDFALQTARLGRTYACAERLSSIADRRPAESDTPDAKSAPPLIGEITLDAVAVKSPVRARGGRKWALDGATISIDRGERMALLGANGSGKSTLLRAVLRLVELDRGRVLFDSVDAREYSADSLRSQMSVVFQDSVLSGLTIKDNVAIGFPDATMEQIEQAVRAAGASPLIARLPAGYETPVRRGGKLFSGGERQRLALARAILRDGSVWLLDEPTASLDHAGVSSLSDALFAATEGRTVLWVTHEMDLLPRFDSVAVLDGGRVIFRGTPAEYADRAGASGIHLGGEPS